MLSHTSYKTCIFVSDTHLRIKNTLRTVFRHYFSLKKHTLPRASSSTTYAQYQHNNGVYYHKKNTKEIVMYNSKAYTFELGKGVEYGDVWELLQFQIMPDARRMITDMVNTKDISNIPQIVDPFIKI